MILRLLFACLLIVPILPVAAARAAPAPFDLAGPALRVSVTHGGATLPISRVPNLSAGDRLSIAVDLPEDQGARYLLIAGFLRGATNPPPKKWFFRAQTWERKHNTLSLTVPDGARQLVLFLMPNDGGDFDAVVDAVRRQPGTFVRASQELNQASLDRARLDTFLARIHELEQQNPESIAAASPLLTRSLAMKLKAECLNQAADRQAACLTQDRESLLLADSHTSSLAETLTGAPTDLAFQLSATPKAGYGYYSPYIGVVRDLIHIFGAFQSVRLQYIPALARQLDDRVTLLLNAAPSFGKPTSVMVVALPAIEPVTAPPLRRADPDQALCGMRRDLVLPVEGAPLIYATRYAHDMTLKLSASDGATIAVPVRADAERGGYALVGEAIPADRFGGVIDARLHGNWGFAPFDGPAFRLQNPKAGGWRAVDAGPGALVVGRDNTLTLQGAAPSCIDGIELRDGSAAAQSVKWKPAGADRISVTLPLAKSSGGAMTLLVHQHGVADPDRIALTALAESARIDGFMLHAGDVSGVLTGTRLDTVASLSVGKVVFKPAGLTRAGGVDHLAMIAADASAATKFARGEAETAKAALAGGRTRALPFTVAGARPVVSLIGKTIERAPSSGALAITIAGEKAVSQDGRLTFSFRAEGTTRLSGGETVEIETADGRASASMTSASGYTIQNDKVAVVSVEPGRALGVSAYGPLRFRLVQDGVVSDWTPLVTLVRLPALTGFSCSHATAPCTLAGASLFLIDAAADNPAFDNPVAIPEGFTGSSVTIPKPASGKLFVRLRDDPAMTASVTLPQK